MSNINTKELVPWPTTIPANNATIVLFTTHLRQVGGSGEFFQPSLKGVLGSSGRLNSIEVTFHRHNKASAANGLRLYALDDTDTWRETDLKDNNDLPTIGSAAPKQVPILSAGQEYRIGIDVSRYRGVALEYTAGADNPEEWNGTIFAWLSVAALQR